MHGCRGGNLGLSAVPGLGFYNPRKIKPLKALLLITQPIIERLRFFLQISHKLLPLQRPACSEVHKLCWGVCLRGAGLPACLRHRLDGPLGGVPHCFQWWPLTRSGNRKGEKHTYPM